jgi:hypothetical protein
LILYQMIAKPPPLSAQDQINSTLHFYRELNRLGITSVVDAGGGGHAYPDDYAGSEVVAKNQLSVRISYYLFPQTAGKEAEDFRRWSADRQAATNSDPDLEHGFELEGAGEFLAHSIGDWENFMAQRPQLDARRRRGKTRRATCANHDTAREAAVADSSARDVRRDHRGHHERIRGGEAPTGSLRTAVRDRPCRDGTRCGLHRIAAMGGGIAIQDRMAFAGEYFVERYGADAARRAPPVRKMLDLDSRRRRDRWHARQQLQPLAITLLARDWQDGRRYAALYKRQPIVA